MSAPTDPAQFVGFKRHLNVVVAGDDAVFLFSESGVTALRGERIAALAALLDGSRDLATVLRAQPAGMGAEQVADLLGELAEADLVAVRPCDDGAADACETAYWDAFGCSDARPAGRVELLTVGEVPGAAEVAGALRRAGVTVMEGVGTAASGPGSEGTRGADVTVVLCDDYLNAGIAGIEARQRDAGRPWWLAKPVGTQIWLGPAFSPGVTACWHCLATRLWGHRHAEACAQATLGRDGPAARPPAATPATVGTAAHLISLEVTKWLAGHRHEAQQRVWTFDSRTLHSESHELRNRPQCSVCGDSDLVRRQGWRPVVPGTVPKASRGSGGDRAVSPEDVRERYRHLISPVTGIIKEITRDPRGPALMHSYRSGPNTAVRSTGMGALRSSLRSESGGKGVTALEAEVGALCEAIERYSGSFHGDEPRVTGSFRELGEHAIHPNSCMLYEERQYATRTVWNATHAPFQYVCDPFDEAVVMDWTPVWSLTNGRHRLLPTEMLYYGAPRHGPSRMVRADSNGNAAGSSLEDAMLQGLLELVERDAVALWWYNRTRMPAIDLDAFGDRWSCELRALYERLGRQVWVLDLTADLGIPVMAAVSRRTGAPREDIMFGFGAHLDPRTALRRALTELNQLTPAVLDLDLDTDDGGEDRDAVHWWRHATVANQPYLLPDTGVPARGPADLPDTSTSDIGTDVEAVRAALESRGMEVLALDQTRPDIGMPVVKMIVPGMRHFWARFAPGRLYDVPVELGRLAGPTPYVELNPLPLFL
ncbi:TOMM precursor leader peptide-binding protein [Haloechinothrix sp. LS1_15]|uniref:TOMM precursor leader peptide-binding protein n=1 Tax=Haloechinothrix sp. LS1_15 TaxID=2652248 RepID=UPI002945A09B|nr:TOMM precursor leader peptide-binding protein [Haloechinothrix sp. LS1_15]MDV6011618.1 TOMM precursor leader peptide-binding protein [Haloechinothrix sp. LS1_15]